MHKAARKTARFVAHALAAPTHPNMPPCIEPLPQDHRFDDPAGRSWPFDLLWQAFLLTQQWWHNATTDVAGVSRHHEQLVSFAARQFLDTLAPSNGPHTNPEVIAATMSHPGARSTSFT